MSRGPSKKKPKKPKKEPESTGISEIELLHDLSPCTIQDYVKGVSAYVRNVNALTAGQKKAAQIRLSNALARSLAEDLTKILPALKGKLVTDERTVAGGLRPVKADVSESHQLDGLRLAVELKPVNLAVGRAIWNRFGDIRTFAVNIHLKFPFAVVGGVLVIPTYEQTGTKAAKEAEEIEEVVAEGDELTELDDALPFGGESTNETDVSKSQKSTVHLIERAIGRLVRAGGRVGEAESAHLLEAIAVVVYDPNTGLIDEDLPKPESGLRWKEFVVTLANSYSARFE